MSTRRSIIFFEVEEIGKSLHVYSEMHDEWIYVEVQTENLPGSNSNASDWHWMRLCPDTPENRAALKAAWVNA